MTNLTPILVGGMDSTGYFRQRIAGPLATALLAAALGGCASTTTTAFNAPHSEISRNTALRLARQVATSVDGKVFAIAPSGSMIPTLDEGSIVTIEQVTFEKLKRGDIVVYRNRSDMTVVHRLYEKHGANWFVLGDHNVSIDRDTVSAANLLGRVCAIFYTSGGDRSAAQAGTPVAVAIADSH